MTNEIEIGEDLEIKKVDRRTTAGGTWVVGILHGHAFNALVFAEHAESPDYELGESKISKLWIQRRSDRHTVVNFDRGWDIRPTTELEKQMVDFLTAGLADYVHAE